MYETHELLDAPTLKQESITTIHKTFYGFIGKFVFIILFCIHYAHDDEKRRVIVSYGDDDDGMKKKCVWKYVNMTLI